MQKYVKNYINKNKMTLQEFTYMFNHSDFLKTFLVMLVLYFILIIPSQGDNDLQFAVIRGIFIVFLFCCVWWAIGNYDVILAIL